MADDTCTGILAFTNEELRNLMDLKVFVDEDPDTCLARRSVPLTPHVTRVMMQPGSSGTLRAAAGRCTAPCSSTTDSSSPPTTCTSSRRCTLPTL